jgi:hypothetical protein
MGFYFPDAKGKEDLSLEQLERYYYLRDLSQSALPVVLAQRINLIHQYIGPEPTGERLDMLKELRRDTIAAWILSGEDPTSMQWVDIGPSAPTTQITLTEEDKAWATEWVDALKPSPFARPQESILRKLCTFFSRSRVLPKQSG